MGLSAARPLHLLSGNVDTDQYLEMSWRSIDMLLKPRNIYKYLSNEKLKAIHRIGDWLHSNVQIVLFYKKVESWIKDLIKP